MGSDATPASHRRPLDPGYGRSVRNSATNKAASPVIHATRKGASIGLEPIAARTNISRLKATTAAAATTPRGWRRTTISTSPDATVARTDGGTDSQQAARACRPPRGEGGALSGRNHRCPGFFPLVRREGRQELILLSRREAEVIDRASQ